MNDSGKSKTESASEAAIREALESVERLERETNRADALDVDDVEVLPASDTPLSGDPSEEGAAEAADDEELIEIDDSAPAKSGGDAMLTAMIAAKNEALSALEQTQREAKSLHERLMRVSADFENFKKRQTRERAEAVKFANEGMLRDLLPVIDNLERAVSAARTSEQENVNALLDGVGMVQKQFVDTLAKFGIQGFSALGQRFDPARHEAVAQREDASVPHETVVEEYQKGYLLHDRLVRPSMVVVGTGGPSAGASSKSAEDGGDDGSEPPGN